MKYLSKDGLRYYHQKKVIPTIQKEIDKVKEEMGGGYVSSETEPEKTNVLWIDTSAGGVIKYYDEDSSAWVATKSVWG